MDKREREREIGLKSISESFENVSKIDTSDG